MFSSLLSIFLSFFAGVFAIFYLWAKWKHSYWQRRGIPSPPTHILFGNFKDSILMKLSPPFLLGRLYKEAKADDPFIGIYIMHAPFLLLRSPELIKRVLVTDFNVFSDRYFNAPETNHDSVGTRGIFSLKNPQWRYMRTKLTPAFTSSKIKNIFNLMLETSDRLKNYLDYRFENDQTAIKSLDFKNLSDKYTLDVISAVTFGVRTDSFQDPTPEFFTKSCYQANMTIIRTLRLFTTFFFPKFKNLLRGYMLGPHTDYFRKIFWSSVDSRESGKYEIGDLIDLLRKMRNEKPENGGFELEGDTLVAQSAIFFIAGLHTSANTMAFTLWELAKHPKIQERLRREILENLDDSKQLTYESIQEMKYLTAVINETLRMYPPAPLIDRVANKDYKIPGTEVVLEKGTVLYVPLPGIQMDAKYHPEPEIYDPDRFTGQRNNDIEPFTFMPFGEGPRSCIGLRVGMLVIAVGLVTVLRDHEVLLNSDEPKNVISSRALFTAPVNGITLNARKI